MEPAIDLPQDNLVLSIDEDPSIQTGKKVIQQFLWTIVLSVSLLTTLTMLVRGEAAAPAINGMGGAISVVMSTDVITGANRHLYVAGRDENAITVFQSHADGSLSFVRAYYDGQDGITGLHYVSEIALSPDNQHLYAVGRLANALTVFRRDPATGALTFLQMLEDDVNGVDGLHEASGVAVSPDGKHVYATASHDSQVSIFSRDAASGLLTYVGLLQNGVNGVKGIGGSFPLIVSPDNQHVYVGGGTDNAIAVFTRTVATGVLSFTQVITAGANNVRGLAGVSGLAISPDGLSLYAASWGTGLGFNSTIAVFSRDPATGALTFVQFHRNKDGGGAIPGMWGALAVDVSLDGKNVYATGLFGNAIVAFNRITDTNTLTFITTTVNGRNGVRGLTYARDIIVDPAGANVYAVSRIDNALVWFKRNAGALVYTDHYRKPIGLADGAQKGLINRPYKFTVAVKGSTPFTYQWQTADGQSVGPVAANLTSTVTFQWTTPGEKKVTVVGSNRDGVFSQTLTVLLQQNVTAADTLAVLKTGQTTCYDGLGKPTECANTGQDGDNPTGLAPTTPRFIKGSGVVTDTLTGLVWLQNADCIRTAYPTYDQHATAGDGVVTLPEGLTFVKGINSGAYANCGAGFTDWRLPNVRELQSLVNFGIGSPVVPNTAGTAPAAEGDPFINLAKAFYWSSSSDEGVPGSFAIDGSTWRGWAVNMNTGATWADDKGGTGAIFGVPMGHVWPVRGTTTGVAKVAQSGQQACYDADGNFIPCAGTGQDGETQTGFKTSSPRFVIGSGVVTDTLTGLVWLQNADCIRTEYPGYDTHNIAGDGIVTWQQGLNFIKGINVGNYTKCAAGHNRWRLPNIRELQSLVDFGFGGPIVADTNGVGKWTPGNPFNNVMNSLYWSSTVDEHKPVTTTVNIWAVGLRTGATWPDVKDGSGAAFGFPMGRVWPVLDTRPVAAEPSQTVYLPIVTK